MHTKKRTVTLSKPAISFNIRLRGASLSTLAKRLNPRIWKTVITPEVLDKIRLPRENNSSQCIVINGREFTFQSKWGVTYQNAVDEMKMQDWSFCHPEVLLRIALEHTHRLPPECSVFLVTEKLTTILDSPGILRMRKTRFDGYSLDLFTYLDMQIGRDTYWIFSN